MPLRNERQAYWDDIDRNIACVDPLSASAALDRVCPAAAKERLALKSRLQDVEAETLRVHRLRARASSEVNVLAHETNAVLNLQAKEKEFDDAKRFVRGRLENDRIAGQRPGMCAAEHAPRAAVGNVPRSTNGVPRGMPFHVPSPAEHADLFRERNERWGSGEVSPLMGGGYTVLLQRASTDLRDARLRHANAERERGLYFMPPRHETGFDETDTTLYALETSANERTTAGMALMGWGGNDTKKGRRRRTETHLDNEENENAPFALPPPRVSVSGGPALSLGDDAGNKTSVATTTAIDQRESIHTVSSVVSHARGQNRNCDKNKNGSGYSAQMAVIGCAGSTAPTLFAHTRASQFPSRDSLRLR